MALLEDRKIGRIHWPLILCVLAIAGLGVWNLASAARGDPIELWKTQLRNLAFGTILITISMFLDYRLLRSLAWPAYGLALAMLVLVKLQGKTTMGGQRWLQWGPLNMQPSEFAKIAVILILAQYFADHPSEDRLVRRTPFFAYIRWWVEQRWEKEVASWRGALFAPQPPQKPDKPVRITGYDLSKLWMPFLLLIIPVALVIRQPDLGTGLVMLLIGACIILFAGLTGTTLLALVGGSTGVVIVAWKFLLKPYQKDRIYTFLDPAGDALGKGYNAIQSLISVGSGQEWGKGWGKGTQNQLRFLPEQHTDFAFPVWAEEHGFVGAAIMVGLFLCLVLFALSIASNARDRFGAYLAFGAAALFFWHAFINIGMVIGVLPVVGVPLLLVSYGGSSAVLTLSTIGVLLNVSLRRMDYR